MLFFLIKKFACIFNRLFKINNSIQRLQKTNTLILLLHWIFTSYRRFTSGCLDKQVLFITSPTSDVIGTSAVPTFRYGSHVD